MRDYPDIEKHCPAWFPPPKPIYDANTPYPTWNPEWLTGLAQFVRAVVREMDRESLPSPACGDCSHYHAAQNATPPEEKPQDGLAERLAREAVQAIYPGGIAAWDRLFSTLLPLFQRAVRGEG